jgi:hypothetical protein
MDDRHNAPAATFDHRETGEPSNDSDPSFSFTDAKRGVTSSADATRNSTLSARARRTYAGLTSGDHVFRVRAVDQARRISEVTRYSWSIDWPRRRANHRAGRPANPTTATDATFGFTTARQA